MKKIQFILTLFCVLALLPACNDDEQGRLTALPSVISDLESTDYTLPKFVEGQNPYLFRMTWTKAEILFRVGITGLCRRCGLMKWK